MLLTASACVPALASETFDHTSVPGAPITQWVEHANGAQQAVTALPIAGQRLFEGDILLARQATQGQQTRGLATSYMGQLWPGGIIPYDVTSNTSAAMRQRVEAAIAHWQAHTPIRFVQRTAQNQAQYSDFVRFTYANFGCASYIGRQVGMQEVYFNQSCQVGNLIHEIGHVVGLYHEHTRADRDQYIRVQYDNVRPERVYNFQVLNTQAVRNLGPYDLSSIMHYGAYFFSRNGQPTIVPHNGRLGDIGQRSGLSPEDINSVAKLYGVDVSLAVRSSHPVVQPEGDIYISYFVSNLSQSDAGALTLRAYYPEQAQVVAMHTSGSGWVCNTASNPVLCQKSALPGSAQSQMSLVYRAPQGLRALSFNASVEVGLGDANAHNNTDAADVSINAQNFPPQLDAGQSFSISSHAQVGDEVGRLTASDPNRDALTYTLFSSVHAQAFSLDTQSGSLRVKDPALLARYAGRSVSLYASVSDGQMGSSQTPFKVRIEQQADAPSSPSGGAPAPISGTGSGGGGGASPLALALLVLTGTGLRRKKRSSA